MKILILGISGRTGMLVAEEALKRGHKVEGIARNPGKVAVEGAQIVAGNAIDLETVRKAIDGCDAVISTLNLFPSTHGLFKKITTPLDSMSVSMQNAVTAMKEKGIRRIVLMTAMGVGDSSGSLPFIFTLLMKISNIKYSYADHDRQEKVLECSGLDWTIVRPVGLNDKNENITVVNTIDTPEKLKSMISRNAVAHFLIDRAEKGDFLRQKPGISNS